jgi:predicted RNA-binding Zn ribbon-like protein
MLMMFLLVMYTSKMYINGLVKVWSSMTAANSAQYSIDSIRLDGGRPCLDFVNTIHDRLAAAAADYLAGPAQYREWCVRAGLLSRQEAGHIAVSAGVLTDARNFREHLHRLLSARIDGTPVPAGALRECDRWLHHAWSSLSLDPGSPGALAWPAAALDARLPLKRIAVSVLEVLREAPQRLKRCASADSCGWLFYDDSKAGRRRWCSMEACGTVEKMRRFRRS